MGAIGAVVKAIAVASFAAACSAACAAAPAVSEPAPDAELGLDVQGHRGVRGLRPENTLPAFELALDLEVTTLELDVHLTADDVVVVWHDPTVSSKKCSGAGPDDAPAIRALSRAQLSAFRCDRNPSPERFPQQRALAAPLAGDAYHIPTLLELFDLVDAYTRAPGKSESQRRNAERVIFNIETKRVPDHPEYIGDAFDGVSAGILETRLLDIVRAQGLLDRFVLQSFDHRSLWAARRLEPRLSLAALTDRDADIESYADKGASIWSPNHEILSPALLSRAETAGLDVIPWTVNDRRAMRRLIDWGVDGIITDRPDALIDELSRRRRR